MPSVTIVANDFITLYYHPEIKVVHHVFHQPAGGADLQEVLNCGTEVLREHQADKWLSDDRKNASLSPADTEWAINTWFTQTREAGWKYWALVVPPDLVSQSSMTQAVQRFTQEGIRTRLFTDSESALAWLKSL